MCVCVCKTENELPFAADLQAVEGYCSELYDNKYLPCTAEKEKGRRMEDIRRHRDAMKHRVRLYSTNNIL